MMITVVVDEIVPAHPVANQGKFRRVEREKFSAVANIINNIAVAGDILWLKTVAEPVGYTIVRARPLVRTNTGGARELSLWLDVVSAEMLATISKDKFRQTLSGDERDKLGPSPTADELQATQTYESWAKHHEVW